MSLNYWMGMSLNYFGMTIIADRWCPTWNYIPHEGWRGFLIRLGIPKRFFKPERREQVFYRVGQLTVCSPETYAELAKELVSK